MFNAFITSSTSPTTSSLINSPQTESSRLADSNYNETTAQGNIIVSTPLNPALGLEKIQQVQNFYFPLDQQARHRTSSCSSTTSHLQSSLPKDNTPNDYFLYASSCLDSSSQQSSLFASSHLYSSGSMQMSSSEQQYTNVNSTTQALSPGLLGSDPLAAVVTLRQHCANSYSVPSLNQRSEETNNLLSTMHSTHSPMHTHLSPSLSTHYETSYRQYGKRPVHDLPPSQPWKSMYGGQISTQGTESSPQSQYLSPPPAHNNTSTLGRYHSPSDSYSVLTAHSLINSTSYLWSDLSAPDSATSTSASEAVTCVRKYHRRSTNSNKISAEVKETQEYKLKRERNNIAVRKSREKAKRRLRENENRAEEYRLSNEQLRNQIKCMNNILNSFRVLLNSCGISQEKINSEIAKKIEPGGYT